MKQYKLTVHHDDSPENPAEYSLFKPHSFSHRHFNTIDPEAVTACAECGDQPDAYAHPEFEQVNDGDWLHADWAAEYREENPDELHKYEPEMEGLFLSYFEHGLCRWGLAGTMEGMPDFRWDGTAYAGFLEFDIPADEREWFDAKSDAEKREMAAGFLEVYTDWCNGEAYGFTLEAVTKTECDHGAEHEEVEYIDSCFGFIGSEHLEGEVRAILKSEGITADQLEIVDEAYGSAEYMDFFKEEAKV